MLWGLGPWAFAGGTTGQPMKTVKLTEVTHLHGFLPGFCMGYSAAAYKSPLRLCLVSGLGAGPLRHPAPVDLMVLLTQGHSDKDSKPSVPLRTRGDKDLAELAWWLPCGFQGLESPRQMLLPTGTGRYFRFGLNNKQISVKHAEDRLMCLVLAVEKSCFKVIVTQRVCSSRYRERRVTERLRWLANDVIICYLLT